MVEKDLAEISTIRKVVLKHDLTTERDVATEVVPFLQPETKRLFEGLYIQMRQHRAATGD